MSLTENMESFAVYPLAHFKNVEIEEGQQLCRKIEKGTGKESRGVIIPKATQEQFLEAMNNDTILGALYEHYLSLREEVTKAAMGETGALISTADFSDTRIAEYLQAQEISEGRISKARIEAWFNAEVSPVLYKAFATKLGEALTNDKAQLLLANYKAAFTMFAKREVQVSDMVYENLDKALAILPDSGIKSYCISKLPSMKEKTLDDWGL